MYMHMYAAHMYMYIVLVNGTINAVIHVYTGIRICAWVHLYIVHVSSLVWLQP